jgi:uncharacterized membrane protein YwzB
MEEQTYSPVVMEKIQSQTTMKKKEIQQHWIVRVFRVIAVTNQVSSFFL